MTDERPPGASASFEDFLQQVARRTTAAIERQMPVAPDDGTPTFSEVATREALALALRGGKRLRPALTALGYLAGGGDDLGRIDGALAAVELLHVSYLVHDDVIDGDRERRGGPALHVTLEATTPSAREAESAAVLAGDQLVGRALLALASSDVDAAALRGALVELASQIVTVNAGQLTDIYEVRATSQAGLEALHRQKTASYTTTGPLRLGALLAGAPGSLVDALTNLGDPMGVAFQLADDCLGFGGDPAVAGKPVGTGSSKFERTARAFGTSVDDPRAALSTVGARVRDLYRIARARIDVLAIAPDPRTLLLGCVEFLERQLTT